jgi:hypothetical protein
MEDSADGFLGEPYIFSEGLLLWLSEPLAALLALIPLNLVPTVETGLHRFYSARVTSHFGIAFFGRKRQNDCGRRNPAFGESPRLGPAGS